MTPGLFAIALVASLDFGGIDGAPAARPVARPLVFTEAPAPRAVGLPRVVPPTSAPAPVYAPQSAYYAAPQPVYYYAAPGSATCVGGACGPAGVQYAPQRRSWFRWFGRR